MKSRQFRPRSLLAALTVGVFSFGGASLPVQAAQTETYAYDANGNRTELVDAKGQVFHYEYDALNRLVRRSGPSLETRYVLDANGNNLRTTQTDSEGTLNSNREYDAFDRVVSETDFNGKTAHYTYFPNGTRQSRQDAAGEVVYGIDGQNRIRTVRQGDRTTSYTYDRNSRLLKTDYGNGSQEERQYDPDSHVQAVTQTANGGLWSTYYYGYDSNGNRTNQVQYGANWNYLHGDQFSYDAADRLVAARYDLDQVTWAYDAAWNRLNENRMDGNGNLLESLQYAYDAQNQLLSVTAQNDANLNVQYTYDANGNVASKTQAGSTWTYEYNARDELLTLQQQSGTDPPVTLGHYRYDDEGLRIERTADNETHKYSWDDDSLRLTLDAEGNVQAAYQYGPKRLLSITESGSRRWYYQDALGSVVGILDEDGSIRARYRYDAWGKLLEEQNNGTENTLGFTGHQRDDESGLYYFKARYYDPELGRFLSEDDYEGKLNTPPSLHKYLYAYDNPEVYWDPDGNRTVERVGEYYKVTEDNGQVTLTDHADGINQDRSNKGDADVAARIADDRKAVANNPLMNPECGKPSAPASCVNGDGSVAKEAYGNSNTRLLTEAHSRPGVTDDEDIRGDLQLKRDRMALGVGRVKEGGVVAGEVVGSFVPSTPREAAMMGVGGPGAKFIVNRFGRLIRLIPRETKVTNSEVSRVLAPGSVEHKTQRWAEYQARNAGNEKAWSYERWSKQYDVNMQNSTGPLQREAEYRMALGGKNVVIKTPFGPRQVDSYVEEGQLLVQIKTGKESLTTISSKMGARSNEMAIKKDAWLVKQGYQVEWVLEKGASKPLLEALRSAGIRYHVGSLIK